MCETVLKVTSNKQKTYDTRKLKDENIRKTAVKDKVDNKKQMKNIK